MRTLSLRSRFLLIVLGGGLLPLVLVGSWLARSAERSGEELLRARMDASLHQMVMEVGTRWVRLRSGLLTLAETDEVWSALAAGAEPTEPAKVLLMPEGLRELPLRGATVLDCAGGVRGHFDGAAPGSRGLDPLKGPVLSIALPLVDRVTGAPRGTMEAALPLGSLLPPGGAGSVGLGSVVAVFDRATGASLLPLPFDPPLLRHARFRWAGEEWITARRALADPTLELVIASPLTPYTQPFEEAARRGWLAVLVVAGFGLLASTLMTRRVTGSLERLALAAAAVADGDLERRVDGNGGREVARVADAFNRMTESLQDTLAELARRQGLAALGEFSAAIAHEIRNPLTSIRIDLQRVAEKVGEDSSLHPTVSRALHGVERLNGTMSGMLRLARSGRIEPEVLDLREPLRGAVHEAAPEFAARGAALTTALETLPAVPITGDAAALQQLFLNLLLNAAQVLDARGSAALHVDRHGREVLVSLRDTGPGLDEEELSRIFEPFYSTRPQGTGLGLAIAQRIAAAHGGRIEMTSAPGEGSVVSVRLPLGDRRGGRSG
jgi:signal transduction histidine kinase